jgi:hypothetical protein
MADRPVPDIVRLVLDYLADVFPEAGASSLKLPQNPSFPHIVISRVTGAEIHRRHQYRALVQFDAWALTQTSASSTIRLLIDRLYQAENTVHDAGILTHVELLAGPSPPALAR